MADPTLEPTPTPTATQENATAAPATGKDLATTVNKVLFILLFLSVLVHFMTVFSNNDLRTKFAANGADIESRDRQIIELTQFRQLASDCINDIYVNFGEREDVMKVLQKYFPQAQRPGTKPAEGATNVESTSSQSPAADAPPAGTIPSQPPTATNP